MPYTPEDQAREQIERQLLAAGWLVQDVGTLNLSAGSGIAVREFSLKQGHGKADYLLKVLAAELSRPPRQWTPETLWQAYESLERSWVRGSGKRMLTDLISLIRFAWSRRRSWPPLPSR